MYDSVKLRKFCPSVQNLSEVNKQHARAWMGYWRGAGFITV